MMRRPRTLRAIRDQLHFTTDADGAHHVRRRWGAGVVVLDFNRETPMSSLLMRGRRLGAQSSWGFPCREWTPSLTSHDVEKVSRLATSETNPMPLRSKP